MGSDLSVHARGRPAFITGGASGIGLAVAHRCAQLRMSPIFLADIDEDRLTSAKRSVVQSALGSGGLSEVVTLVADVASLADNERVAAAVWDRTGGDLAFLFLNAGITTLRFGVEALWTTRPEDYRRVLSIDLDGVWFGIRNFVPRMIATGREGLVLSTASVAGLMNSSDFTNFSYQIAKHGVVLMMELLASGFAEKHPQLHAAVLCPFLTKTRIGQQARVQDAASAGVAPANVPHADFIAAAVAQAEVPVSVLLARLEHELRRGAFYIVSPDKTSDVEVVSARMRLKREAVELGLPPQMQVPRHSPALRAAKAAREAAIKMGGPPPLAKL